MKDTIRRWGAVVFLITVSFLLGFCGFSKWIAENDKPLNSGDAVYLTIQLFVLESGFVEGQLNRELQVARFLAPVSAAVAIVQTVFLVFSLQIQRVWLRLFGGHLIICGLGQKGVRLVEQFRRQQQRVVVIEPDEQNRDLSHCRGLGAIVFVGRADDPWVLRQASAHRARMLISVAGEDGVNIECAMHAHEVNHLRASGSLSTVIHVRDPDLQSILKQHSVFTREDSAFQVAFINTYETAARVMLREPPVLASSDDADAEPFHMLIVGFGRMGNALLFRLIRDWHIDHPDAARQLRVTVIDLDADRRREAFQLRHAELAQAAQIDFVATDVRSSLFVTGELARRQLDSVQAAYVCLSDDSLSVYAALTMRRWLPEQVPIVVRMSVESGLASLLETERGGGVIQGIRAVGLLEVACSLELVQGGSREALAQAIHQGYIKDQTALGKTAAANPSMCPWHELPQDLKQSNRAQADDIPVKLRAVNCAMRPQVSGHIQVLQFSDEEIEQLAEIEHQRFVDEREASGWSYGTEKDLDARTSPYLIPWDDERLPEDVKDYDRHAVRRLPSLLAKADYEVYRLTDGP